MNAVIVGKFMEQNFREDKNTGEKIPVANIYSGSEIVKVVGCECKVDFGKEVEIPVSISQGKYGLFVKAFKP